MNFPFRQNAPLVTFAWVTAFVLLTCSMTIAHNKVSVSLDRPIQTTKLDSLPTRKRTEATKVAKGTAYTPKGSPAPPKSEIFTVVEQMPEFPGGQVAMMKYLRDNLMYPALARENGIVGKVFVKFVVNEDGTIADDIVVVRGIGGGCDQEAVRLIKSMPLWKGGKHKGKPVKVCFTMPVLFKLE